MPPIRVLVLENHSFVRSVTVIALERLGVVDILQASTDKDAMALMRMQGSVDIAICDVAHQSMDYLAFLRRASQFGMVRAMILYGDLEPESYRAVEQMASLSGLELLGALSKPLQLRPLQKTLRRYSGKPQAEYPVVKAHVELPNEDDIHRGLALGEFSAHFQPKCILTNGTMVGAEVLVRWQHPTKGLLQPKDFLAAVLAYDLIDEVFKQLLEQGLSLQAVLRRQGQRLELAFNLQASQLLHNGLVKHIKQRLAYHKLSGSDLIFELAENGLLEMQQATQTGLMALRMMGCGLAIDDFAAGFSSMKLLCLLPFTQIKLDSEFVRNFQKPESKVVVAGTLALAKALNMELVIQGVSHPHEHLELLTMGCFYGQGFYYGRPMTAHALLSWSKTLNGRL